VRRTFEDYNGVRAVLECLGTDFQEHDVFMGRSLRDELWALAGDRAVPPRLFVRGRDLGGAVQEKRGGHASLFTS
jgi:glutaredoxin domain-containing cysteine-rich protein 1